MASKRNLASSAMVDLKAELHRKQEEFRRQKVDYGQNVKGRKVEKVKTKKSIWNQQNQGVSERAKRDLEETKEVEDDLDKSRRMLAHKTRLYDEMTSTSIVPDEDGSEGFLVDFQRKVVDRMVEDREKQRKTEEEEKEDEAEKKALAEPIAEPVDSDEEWVDFTDSLGRSRRCMKKDIGKMKEKDRVLSGELKSKVVPEKGNSDSSKVKSSGADLPDLVSSDMYKERMRQKWEEEERALMEKGQEEIHYSNVQYDEIRSHGVGYYKFSKDHQDRQEQMEQLKKLREETEKETSRKDKIQAKRKAMMEARLAKVRDRRKLKDAPMSDTKSEEEKVEAEAAEQAKKAKEEEERKMKEAVEREATEVRKNHIREWDKEKQKNSWSGKGYADTRRNEREAEFAPPSVYFDNKPIPHVKSKGVSDEMRLNRLKNSIPSSKANADFAPPSCYFEQDKITGDVSGRNDKKTERIPNDHCGGNSGFSSKSLDEDKNSLNSKKFELNAESVCLESIPLPADSVDEGKDNATINQYTCTPSTTVTTHRHVMDMELNSSNYGHYQQYYHQPQQHHHQQQQQPPQNLFPQQTYDACYTPQQLTHDNNPLLYQYQHPNTLQQNQYQQQQEHSSQKLTQSIPQPPSHQPHENTAKLPQKRPLHQPATSSFSNKSQETKPKAPKRAIMDTRFMLNDDPTTSQHDPNPSPDTAITNDTSFVPSSVEAVPYQPGSFTAARFPEEVTAQNDLTNPGHDSNTAQIAGGPQLYSQEQLEEQHKQMDEEGTDQKVSDFLASIRAETKQ